MAIPTYVGAGTGKSDILALPNVTWPAGHQADDIGVLVVQTANQTVTTPSGWTAITPQGIGTAGAAGATRLMAFWKRAASTSEAAVAVDDSGDHQTAKIFAFRGCHAAGDPVNIVAGDTAVASTAVSIPGATTTAADCLAVLLVANATDNTSASQLSGEANAGLVNLTIRNQHQSGSGNGGGYTLLTGEKATIGAFGATTGTLATSSAQARVAFALKPPDAGTATFGGLYVATGEKATAGAIGASTGTLFASAVQARLTIALKPPTPVVNTAPTLTTVPALFVFVDDELDHPVTATDPEGDAITFGVFPGSTAVPSGLEIDATSGTIRWTPLQIHEGVWNVTIRATDAGGLFDEQAVTITVAGPGPTVISAYSGGLVSIT